MLSYSAVDPHTLELLKAVMQQELFAPLRLVGGTALALQYGHRQSVDLDLFGAAQLDAIDTRQVLSQIGKLSVVKETPNIKCYLLDGIKIDIVNYSYSWIADMIESEGIRLASDKDIAAMKINAIQGRGSKKDFIDLYFLLQRYSLQEILDYYCEKYPEHSLFRAMMSLHFFDDADVQMMPKMFAAVSWEQMKACISIVVNNAEKY